MTRRRVVVLSSAVALLSLVAISADFASPATWAFNQDIGGRFIAWAPALLGLLPSLPGVELTRVAASPN